MLHNINITNYDIISFDIFDTLLYRLCNKPDDIFSILGEQAKLNFKSEFKYSPSLFKKLRVKAEELARGNKKSEVTLEEIYNYLPIDNDLRFWLRNKELELEKNYCVINPYIYEFIENIKATGKRVIFISDMYLKELEITNILETIGFDLELIHKIYVSSEYGESKSNGKLYDIVIKDMNTTNILHIGDNFISDVQKAQLAGIDAFYYDAIIEDISSRYNIEEKMLGKSTNHLRSLRKIVSRNHNYIGKEATAYELGASVYGMVYTIFGEWIIKKAEEKGITTILPLMREGYLYTEILENIVNKHDLNVSIKPLYISRRATYLSSFDNYTEENLIELLLKESLSLKTICETLHLPFSKFEDYKNLFIWELKKNGLYNDFYNFLVDSLPIINENIIEYKAMQKEYIMDLCGGNPFLTVDFGFGGTMQKLIHDLLGEEIYNEHLLFTTGSEFLDKVQKGYRIESWVDFTDELELMKKEVTRSPEVIESITNVSIGSTRSYGRDDNLLVYPILEEVNYSEKHIEYQRIFWEGLFEFQNMWLKHPKRNELLHIIINKSDEMLNILRRLIKYPLTDEVKVLSEMIQIETHNFTVEKTIVSEHDIEFAKKFTTETFLKKTLPGYFPHKIYWPEGTVELINPGYFKTKFVKEFITDPIEKQILEMLDNLSDHNNENIYIYGAGEIGLKVLEICEVFNIEVAGFIDRNHNKMNDGFKGKRVISLSEAVKTAQIIIVASVAFREEIVKDISLAFGNQQCEVLAFS